MGHRHQQHQGRSADDDRKLPGRDVQVDPPGTGEEPHESQAVSSGPDAGEESGEKPTRGKGGALDAE